MVDRNKLTFLAKEAKAPRERCEGKNCNCNDYSKRMRAFHNSVTPDVLLELLEPDVIITYTEYPLVEDKKQPLSMTDGVKTIEIGYGTANWLALVDDYDWHKETTWTVKPKETSSEYAKARWELELAIFDAG